ncbi:MAG: hypothetical protein ACTSUV_01510 [Candidatus Ranarchaeia archaeon]
MFVIKGRDRNGLFFFISISLIVLCTSSLIIVQVSAFNWSMFRGDLNHSGTTQDSGPKDNTLH